MTLVAAWRSTPYLRIHAMGRPVNSRAFRTGPARTLSRSADTRPQVTAPVPTCAPPLRTEPGRTAANETNVIIAAVSAGTTVTSRRARRSDD